MWCWWNDKNSTEFPKNARRWKTNKFPAKANRHENIFPKNASGCEKGLKRGTTLEQQTVSKWNFQPHSDIILLVSTRAETFVISQFYVSLLQSFPRYSARAEKRKEKFRVITFRTCFTASVLQGKFLFTWYSLWDHRKLILRRNELMGLELNNFYCLLRAGMLAGLENIGNKSLSKQICHCCRARKAKSFKHKFDIKIHHSSILIFNLCSTTPYGSSWLRFRCLSVCGTLLILRTERKLIIQFQIRRHLSETTLVRNCNNRSLKHVISLFKQLPLILKCNSSWQPLQLNCCRTAFTSKRTRGKRSVTSVAE